MRAFYFQFLALFGLGALSSLLVVAPAEAQTANAVELDGAGDYLNPGLLDPGSVFTFEAWTRMDSVATPQAVVSAAQLTDGLNAFYLGYFANTSQWIVELDDDDQFEADDCADNNTLCVNVTQSAGVPLHLAVVVQGTVMTLFFDGIQVATQTADTPPVFGLDNWILGAETDGGPFGTDPFIGLLDEVRVWSVARSEADIQCTKDWALTGLEGGLYAHWSMDEGPFSISAADSLGNFDAGFGGNPTFVASPFGLTQSVGGDIPCLETDLDQDGWTNLDGDCDDNDAGANPGATEVCNEIDDNCDGQVDEGFDADGDGFVACGDEADCNDLDPNQHPGAEEICDGADSDCDGTLDPEEWDEDGDGWAPCENDCDDANFSVNPGVVESCNGADDDCDGQIGGDEFDADGDSYRPCSGDCDDTRADVNPLATENCDDGVDNDCDGFIDQSDPDCPSGDDDDTVGDDDDTVGDDDDTVGDDDDTVPPSTTRRDNCSCGGDVTGQTGFFMLLLLGVFGPVRRRR